MGKCVAVSFNHPLQGEVVYYAHMENGKAYVNEGNTTHEYASEDWPYAVKAVLKWINSDDDIVDYVLAELKDWDCVAVATDEDGVIFYGVGDSEPEAWDDWNTQAGM